MKSPVPISTTSKHSLFKISPPSFTSTPMTETAKTAAAAAGDGVDRWRASIVNISEMSANLDSLQRILAKKAVFVDDETFTKASLTADQAKTIKVLEHRVETLERELDAAIAAAARARSEKRQAEAGQRAAELHALEVTRELENTSKVFKLHMEELRAKQEEISKRDHEIKVLEAIIQTLSGNDSNAGDD